MKQTILGLLLIVCLGFSLPANSQINFGLKVGTNFSKNDFEALTTNISNLKNTNIKIKGTGGFYVGPMMDIRIPVLGLGMDAGFHYSLRKFSIDNRTDNITENTSQHSFMIPVNLKYNLGLGDVIGIYFTAGPLFEFNINPETFWKDVTVAAANKIDGNEYSYNRKSTEIALSFGAGLKILGHIQLGFNYNLGLTDAAKGSATDFVKSAWDNNAVKNREWQISAAYLF